SHLGGGGLLAYPTETVYGLGSRPTADDVSALGRLKGRRPGKPFLLLVASGPMVHDYALTFTTSAEALARAFCPGPLPLVWAGGEGALPESLRGAEGGIAVRWTSHPGLGQLIGALRHPLTSTSANRAGSAPAPGAAAVEAAFAEPIKQGVLMV